MQPLTVNKTSRPRFDSGFTMLELLVVVLIIGIMAAIASPGMLGFLARTKVTTAHGELQGVLKEIQRTAINKSRSCNITLPTSGDTGAFNITSVVTPATTPALPCLPTGTRSLENIQIRHNFATVKKTSNTENNLFDFRGDTREYLDSDLVIVLSNEDTDNFQKCIVVSSSLGLIRAGNYPNNDTTTDITKCSPN